MNTQEILNKIEQLPSHLIDKKVVISKDSVVELVKQLDERSKVKIPRFMSDWIEENRRNFKRALLELVKECYEFVFDEYTDIHLWFLDKEIDSFTILVNAYQFSYEVEQEKLYTVEIPDPNANGYSIVLGRKDGKVQIKQTLSTTWEMNCSNQLTASEIRQDFDWAWQFAKAVEVER